MANFLLKEAARRLREINIKQGVDMLQGFPSQYPIIGSRSFMLFQPHQISDALDESAWKVSDTLLGVFADQFIDDGRKVVFYIEDANKKANSLRREREAKLRSGHNVGKTIEERLSFGTTPGDEEGAYHTAQLTTFGRLIKEHPGQNGEQNIMMLFENMPKIQSAGHRTFREIDPRQYSVETAHKRMNQLMAYIATRDIASSAQLIRELQTNPQSAFLVMRGSAHLGMATCLEELAEMAYPQYKGMFADVDKQRIFDGDDVMSSIALPVLWKREFWRQVFDRYPYVLKSPDTYSPGQDMNRVSQTVRSVLDSAPWSDYMRNVLDQISQTRDMSLQAVVVLNQGSL